MAKNNQFPYICADRVRRDIDVLRRSLKQSTCRADVTDWHCIIEGIIPMEYNRISYNIPVKIDLPPHNYGNSGYPNVAPVCHVNPSPSMIVNTTHPYIRPDGLIQLQCLAYWSSKSEIEHIVVEMRRVFEIASPVYQNQNRNSNPEIYATTIQLLKQSWEPAATELFNYLDVQFQLQDEVTRKKRSLKDAIGFLEEQETKIDSEAKNLLTVTEEMRSILKEIENQGSNESLHFSNEQILSLVAQENALIELIHKLHQIHRDGAITLHQYIDTVYNKSLDLFWIKKLLQKCLQSQNA